MRASLAPSSLSPTAPTPSPAIGSLCRVAGFSEPIAQPGSRRLRSRRQRLRHRQQQLVRYAGLPGSANQLRSHRQQLIRYAGLPGSSEPIVQTGSLRIDRFDLSGHNTGIRRYTADSSDDAPATGTASACFFASTRRFFFTTTTTTGLNSSQQPSGCTSKHHANPPRFTERARLLLRHHWRGPTHIAP